VPPKKQDPLESFVYSFQERLEVPRPSDNFITENLEQCKKRHAKKYHRDVTQIFNANPNTTFVVPNTTQIYHFSRYGYDLSFDHLVGRGYDVEKRKYGIIDLDDLYSNGELITDSLDFSDSSMLFKTMFPYKCGTLSAIDMPTDTEKMDKIVESLYEGFTEDDLNYDAYDKKIMVKDPFFIVKGGEKTFGIGIRESFHQWMFQNAEKETGQREHFVWFSPVNKKEYLNDNNHDATLIVVLNHHIFSTENYKNYVAHNETVEEIKKEYRETSPKHSDYIDYCRKYERLNIDEGIIYFFKFLFFFTYIFFYRTFVRDSIQSAIHAYSETTPRIHRSHLEYSSCGCAERTRRNKESARRKRQRQAQRAYPFPEKAPSLQYRS
jgi:hypothetical protein